MAETGLFDSRFQTAPPYVESIYDDPRYHDRFTVILSGPLGLPEPTKEVKALFLSDYPNHPRGVSQFSPIDKTDTMIKCGCKIHWQDMPVEIRHHIRLRCETGKIR